MKSKLGLGREGTETKQLAIAAVVLLRKMVGKRFTWDDAIQLAECFYST
jgi:hypothetical protein